MTNECRYINSLYLDCSTFLCQLYSGWKRPFFLFWMTGRELSRRELDFLMLLSDKTLLGLRMTGIYFHTCNSVALASFLTANSFVSLVRMLFSLDEVKDKNFSFLSFTLNQDPLEGFFGCQRQRGQTGDNPSAQEFFKNTAALCVVNSFCRYPTKSTLMCLKIIVQHFMFCSLCLR